MGKPSRLHPAFFLNICPWRKNRIKQQSSGWWFCFKDFLEFSPPKLGKMNPIWRSYFSKGSKLPTSLGHTRLCERWTCPKKNLYTFKQTNPLQNCSLWRLYTSFFDVLVGAMKQNSKGPRRSNLMRSRVEIQLIYPNMYRVYHTCSFSWIGPVMNWCPKAPRWCSGNIGWFSSLLGEMIQFDLRICFKWVAFATTNRWHDFKVDVFMALSNLHWKSTTSLVVFLAEAFSGYNRQ